MNLTECLVPVTVTRLRETHNDWRVRILVTVRRHPGLLGRLMGRKPREETYWTDDTIYWFDSMGKEVAWRAFPDSFLLKEMVREHDARVKLFGETLA